MSGFVEGAKVWVEDTGLGYREDTVLKVHKSGRFTLKSDPHQQYRPNEAGVEAWATGRREIWQSRARAVIDGGPHQERIEQARELATKKNLVGRIQSSARCLDPKGTDLVALQAVERALDLALGIKPEGSA